MGLQSYSQQTDCNLFKGTHLVPALGMGRNLSTAHEYPWGCLPRLGTITAMLCPTPRQRTWPLSSSCLELESLSGSRAGAERLSIVLDTRVQGSELLRTCEWGGREEVGGRKTVQLSPWDLGTCSFVHLISQDANFKDKIIKKFIEMQIIKP